MRKIYFLFLLLSSGLTFGQTEIFNLSGGGTFPAGWVDTNNVTTNLIDRTSYYLIDAGAPSDVIESATYDLSAYSSAQLRFNIRSFGSGTHNSAYTEISYDNGATYAETDTSPITTTTYTTHTINLASVSNQVKIRFSTQAATGRGIRFQNIILEATGTDPDLTFTAPTDGTVFASGTASVNININVVNFMVDALPSAGGTGDGHIHWTINTNGGGAVSQPMKYDTNTESIAVVDGSSYVVEMTLVDNTHNPIVPAVTKSVSFSVAYPCDLQLGSITTTCDTETAGVDTYTTTIAFTGGGTSTYTINTGGTGIVGGDNPSSVASGNITITNVNEGTDFSVNVTGDSSNSSCNINRNITSPVCIAASCSPVGSIIVTEIMKNPNAVTDANGEYFEVYNTTGAPIDMQGWIISDADTESHTIASSVVVPAMGYAVFGINSNFGTNGGVTVNYQYSGFNLANGSDEVQLECPATTIIDAVAYTDATFPDTAGVAMELDPNTFNSADNDNGANWGDSATDIGAGPDKGTPGAVNNPVLSIANNVIEGFTIYPNPSDIGYVNILTASNDIKDVTIYDLLGKQVINQTTNSQINISSLQTGVYVIKVEQNNKVATKRLIVK